MVNQTKSPYFLTTMFKKQFFIMGLVVVFMFPALEAPAQTQTADPAVNAGIRTVFARIGIVLTPRGGALRKVLLPFLMGLGSKVGNGKNFMSWIGIDDLIAGFYHILMNNNISGPVNFVAPNPISNNDFTKTIGSVLKRPVLFSIPSVIIKTILGKMGKETVLSSTRVKPEKLLDTGFNFRHPDLEHVLRHLLGRL